MAEETVWLENLWVTECQSREFNLMNVELSHRGLVPHLFITAGGYIRKIMIIVIMIIIDKT